MRDILPLKAYVTYKREPPPCFSRKIDTLWIAPFLQNRGDVASESLYSL